MVIASRLSIRYNNNYGAQRERPIISNPMMHQQTLLWAGFVAFIVIMLALDLGLFQRGK